MRLWPRVQSHSKGKQVLDKITRAVVTPAVVRLYYQSIHDIYLQLWGRRLHGGLFMTPHDTLAQAQNQMDDLIITNAPLTGNALEVGSGWGVTALHLAAVRPELQITGLNISPEQVAYGHYRAGVTGLSQVDFVLGDAMDMLFSNETYNYVYSLEALFHMDHAKVFDEIYRVLTPGGIVAFTTISNRGMSGADDALFRAMGAIREYYLPETHLMYLENLGFKVLTNRDISAEVAPTMPATVKIFNEKRDVLIKSQGKLMVQLMGALWSRLDAIYQNGVGYHFIVAQKV